MMKCPIDSTDLQMTDRQGIEIDYCPKCRGVWLDRGELDKLIERSDQNTRSYANKDEDEDEDSRGVRGIRKKRGGFLGDLLDFGD